MADLYDIVVASKLSGGGGGGGSSDFSMSTVTVNVNENGIGTIIYPTIGDTVYLDDETYDLRNRYN